MNVFPMWSLWEAGSLWIITIMCSALLRCFLMKNGLNISQRNITLSTCGIVPRIYDLAKEELQITLAISLHAVNDQRRRELMPVANTWSIDEILKACREYYGHNNRRLTFEYSLVKGGQ